MCFQPSELADFVNKQNKQVLIV